MKFLAILSILAAMTFAISYSMADPKPQPTTEATQASSAASQEATSQLIVKGSNEFAFDLYAKLAAKEKGNLFFSPCSIHTALAMTYAGAAGDTAKQMAKTLHLTLSADKLSAGYGELLNVLNSPPEVELLGESDQVTTRPAYELVIANSLWSQKGYAFKPTFTQLLQESYGAGLNEIDFAQSEQARKTINDWVAKQTKDKIKEVIPQGFLNPSGPTRLVLANAIYFKSGWADKFSKDETENGPFKLSADKSVTVPMMRHKPGELSFGYTANDYLQMLNIPYAGKHLSMLILLPKKVDGLADIEKHLTADNIAKWVKDEDLLDVDVTLPKFKFASTFMLADTLMAMGMADAFDPSKASFSKMTDRERLSIDAVIHKALVAVDEEGTEAAGATVVSGGGGGLPEAQLVFKAEHPFIFMIRHNSTGEILFLGRVTNPKSE